MEKLQSYEQYSQVLAAFKEGRERCGTNKLMTRDELTALIEAGKLWYEQTGDTLWFFSDEGYFYTGVFYVPADRPIQMRRQDMDVRVEQTGNGGRYNQSWENELCRAGYEKYDRHLEYARDLADIVGQMDDYVQANRARWEGHGLTWRKAVKADYPRLWEFWMERFGMIRYTIAPMTAHEQEQMERDGRCLVIFDPEGKIVATWKYSVKNKTAYGYNLAANYPDRGLGTFILYLGLTGLYREGYERYVGWLRDDNLPTLNLHKHILRPTGKFYWQFVCRSDVNPVQESGGGIVHYIPLPLRAPMTARAESVRIHIISIIAYFFLSSPPQVCVNEEGC